MGPTARIAALWRGLLGRAEPPAGPEDQTPGLRPPAAPQTGDHGREAVSDDPGSRSDSPADVLTGEDGWLFLWGGSNEVHRYYTTPDHFTPEDAQAWVALLESRAARLSASGIAYRHLTVPDKISVLPDKIPVPLPHFDGHPVRRLDAHLTGVALHVPVLDGLRALAASGVAPFYQTDSHWTHEGCLVAYRALCESLGTVPRDFSDRKAGSGRLMSMDLGSKLDPPRQEHARFVPVLRDAVRVHANAQVRYNEETGLRTGQPHFVGCYLHLRNDTPRARPERVVLFGDSFAEFRPHLLTAMLAETFREVHFVWSTSLDLDLIADLRPDIVVTEIAERFVGRLPDDQFHVDIA